MINAMYNMDKIDLHLLWRLGSAGCGGILITALGVDRARSRVGTPSGHCILE